MQPWWDMGLHKGLPHTKGGRPLLCHCFKQQVVAQSQVSTPVSACYTAGSCMCMSTHPWEPRGHCVLQ